ncbi:MAG: SHOCT domain-containing protein [Cryobacterium sp.]
MMWGNGIDPGWIWLYGLLAMASLVVVIVWAARALRNDRGPGATNPGDARRILDERYARGELSAEQYRQQVADLGEEP